MIRHHVHLDKDFSATQMLLFGISCWLSPKLGHVTIDATIFVFTTFSSFYRMKKWVYCEHGHGCPDWHPGKLFTNSFSIILPLFWVPSRTVRACVRLQAASHQRCAQRLREKLPQLFRLNKEQQSEPTCVPARRFVVVLHVWRSSSDPEDFLLTFSGWEWVECSMLCCFFFPLSLFFFFNPLPVTEWHPSQNIQKQMYHVTNSSYLQHRLEDGLLLLLVWEVVVLAICLGLQVCKICIPVLFT